MFIEHVVKLPFGLRDEEIIERYRKGEVDMIEQIKRENLVLKYELEFTSKFVDIYGPNHVATFKHLIRYWAEQYIDKGIKPNALKETEIVEWKNGLT